MPHVHWIDPRRIALLLAVATAFVASSFAQGTPGQPLTVAAARQLRGSASEGTMEGYGLTLTMGARCPPCPPRVNCTACPHAIEYQSICDSPTPLDAGVPGNCVALLRLDSGPSCERPLVAGRRYRVSGQLQWRRDKLVEFVVTNCSAVSTANTRATGDAGAQ